MEQEKIKCPKCKSEKQHKRGLTVAGSQRFFCSECEAWHTPNKKKWAYTEEEKSQALKLIAVGNTGRGVGKIMGMSKSNAYRWATEVAKKRL